MVYIKWIIVHRISLCVLRKSLFSNVFFLLCININVCGTVNIKRHNILISVVLNYIDDIIWLKFKKNLMWLIWSFFNKQLIYYQFKTSLKNQCSITKEGTITLKMHIFELSCLFLLPVLSGSSYSSRVVHKVGVLMASRLDSPFDLERCGPAVDLALDKVNEKFLAHHGVELQKVQGRYVEFPYLHYTQLSLRRL